MADLDVETLERTFQLLAPNADKMVARFYQELFIRHPAVKPMFAGLDQKQQEKKLVAALSLVVNNLRKPDVLLPTLQKLGERHQGYGAEAAHYGAVAETLLDVMAEFAGPVWTPQVKKAWTDALNTVAEIMLGAYVVTCA